MIPAEFDVTKFKSGMKIIGVDGDELEIIGVDFQKSSVLIEVRTEEWWIPCELVKLLTPERRS